MSACKAQFEKNADKVKHSERKDDSSVNHIPASKAIKNNSVRGKYIGHLGLFNEKKKVTEYYKLYHDEDVGFEGLCQKLVKEAVYYYSI